LISNKLYTSGITFERLSMKDHILSTISSANAVGNTLESEKKNQKFLSEDNKQKLKEILKEVEKMAYGDAFELEYTFPSYLLKQKLTSIVKERFPGMYTYYKKNESVFKVMKGKNYSPPSEQISSIQDDLFNSDDNDQESEGPTLGKLEKSHGTKVANQYRNEMGFTLIIEEMIKSKKPLVGHN
jgi:hypothetical protein